MTFVLECVSSGTIHSKLRIVPLETHSNVLILDMLKK